MSDDDGVKTDVIGYLKFMASEHPDEAHMLVPTYQYVEHLRDRITELEALHEPRGVTTITLQLWPDGAVAGSMVRRNDRLDMNRAEDMMQDWLAALEATDE